MDIMQKYFTDENEKLFIVCQMYRPLILRYFFFTFHCQSLGQYIFFLCMWPVSIKEYLKIPKELTIELIFS